MSQRVKIALYALTKYLQNKFRRQPKNKRVFSRYLVIPYYYYPHCGDTWSCTINDKAMR